MVGPIDVKQNGYPSNECWANHVTSTFHLTHDIGLRFSRSDFDIVVSRGWEERFDIYNESGESIGSWTHYIYVTLRYDLELGFQGQISKTPYVVIPTVILTLDHPWPWTRIVKLRLSKTYISATGGPLDIERKAYEYDAMLDPLCQLELWPQLLFDSEYLDFHGKILKWLYFWNGWTYWYETSGI